jgi:hypothetical protein
MVELSEHAASLHSGLNSSRAAKLKAQAYNCISIALEASDDPFAADLLDEAARLLTRAHEIGARKG